MKYCYNLKKKNYLAGFQEMQIDHQYSKLITSLFNGRYAASIFTSKTQREVTHYLSSYPPEWAQHYLEQQYHLYDPALLKTVKPLHMNIWGETTYKKAPKTARQLYAEASDYGIRSGFSIALPDKDNNFMMLCIATSDKEEDYRRYLNMEKHNLFPMFFMVQALINRLNTPACPQPLIRKFVEGIKYYQQRNQRHVKYLLHTMVLIRSFLSKLDFLLNLQDREQVQPLSEEILRQIEHLQ